MGVIKINTTYTYMRTDTAHLKQYNMMDGYNYFESFFFTKVVKSLRNIPQHNRHTHTRIPIETHKHRKW